MPFSSFFFFEEFVLLGVEWKEFLDNQKQTYTCKRPENILSFLEKAQTKQFYTKKIEPSP